MHPIIKKIRHLMRQCSPKTLTAAEQATLDALIVSVTADKISFSRASTLETHSDDAAVGRFASAMKTKLALSRGKGRCGWQEKDSCDADWLSELLRAAVVQGDAVNVANYAMMLHQRGEKVTTREACPRLDRMPSLKDSPLTVSLSTENGGIRVLVWHNAECVYSQAHAHPTGDAIPDPHIEADVLDPERLQPLSKCSRTAEARSRHAPPR